MKEKIEKLTSELKSRLDFINSKPLYAREGQSEHIIFLQLLELIEELNNKIDDSLRETNNK